MLSDKICRDKGAFRVYMRGEDSQFEILPCESITTVVHPNNEKVNNSYKGR